MKITLVVALLLGSQTALSAPNLKLQNLLQDDQSDRLSVQGKPWKTQITERDMARAKAVRSEIAAGNLKEAKDYYAAALILQHGQKPDDLRLANALSWIAYEMAENKESVPAREASWLYAMSWDRLMLKLNKKQWYQTQYARDPVTFTRGSLLPFDPSAATKMDLERFSGPRY